MTVELPVKLKVTGLSEIKLGLSELQGSWDLQKKAIEGMVGALGATAVFTGAISFLKSAHEAAQQSRTSITLLTNQLGFYSSALDDQAEALSKNLFIQKNEILAADQRLLIYTREESSIKKLIPGIIDLAKVKGIDLVTASNNVGLALKRADESAAGHIITIRGLGVAFKATGTEAGNVAALQDALAKAVGGSAKAVADSLDGWSKLSFWIGKANEDIGKLVFGVSASEEKSRKYNASVVMLADNQKELVKINEAAKTSTTYYGQSIEEARKYVEDNIAALTKEVKAYESETKAAKESTTNRSKEAQAAEENGKLQEEADNLTLASKKNKLLKEKAYAISVGADIALVNKVYGDKIAKIDEEIAAKKQEALHKQAEAEKRDQEQREKAAKEYEDKMAADAKAAWEEKQKLTIDGYKNQERMDIAAAGKLKNNFDKEKALVKAKFDYEIKAARLKGQETAGLEQEEAEKIREIDQQNVIFKKQVLGNTLSMMDQLTAGSKKAAGLHKATASGEALVSAGEAEMGVIENSGKFIKTFGPVAGPIIMGVEMAMIAGIAAEQIASIAAAKMGYGGVVRGGTPGVDSVPAMLMPGEIVYNPVHPNPALASMISNTDNSSAVSHHYNISMPITIHGNPTNTTIAKVGEVTEKAVLSAMRRLQNTGKISAIGLTIRH